MRPRTLQEYQGQSHILAPGKLLRRAIEADRIGSLILYGPAGTGKTSLARIITQHTKSHFVEINATSSSVAELRKISAHAADKLHTLGETTTLFIDEIHRFNRSQQDSLLPDVERGILKLIGATTQNPFFSVNSPLISRSQVFELKPLTFEELQTILQEALSDPDRGYGKKEITIEPEALKLLCDRSDGDARRALNGLELAVLTTTPTSDGKIHIDLAVVEESIQKKAIVYDGDGDAHYDTISAFIKSMRGSDPNATLYWLAKMIEAGEEPRFIARRIVIHAAEDVGLADPTALLVATAAQSAVETIGMPEARIPLAQAALHVALAPKSNSACAGIDTALNYIQTHRLQDIPKPLRDAHYAGASKLGNGANYLYPHDFPFGVVEQNYMPEDVQLYTPGIRGIEAKLNENLQAAKQMAAHLASAKDD
jgi:putative ATPase